jgi:hypothetical protein
MIYDKPAHLHISVYIINSFHKRLQLSHICIFIDCDKTEEKFLQIAVIYFTLGISFSIRSLLVAWHTYEGHFLSKNRLRIFPAKVIVRRCFKVNRFLYPSSKALSACLTTECVVSLCT